MNFLGQNSLRGDPLRVEERVADNAHEVHHKIVRDVKYNELFEQSNRAQINHVVIRDVQGS